MAEGEAIMGETRIEYIPEGIILDIYLLANSNLYFGSDAGVKSVAITFMRPCYGVNWSSTLLYSDPGLFINSNNHLHPWLFIFKRIKNLDNGELLPLRKILKSEYASSGSSFIFKKNNKEQFDKRQHKQLMSPITVNIISFLNIFQNIFIDDILSPIQ